MMENLNKLYVSKALKTLNRKYRRNFTVDDVAAKCDTSRQTLVRLSGASSFDLVKRVIFTIYGLYQYDLINAGNSYEVALHDIMQLLIFGFED